MTKKYQRSWSSEEDVEFIPLDDPEFHCTTDLALAAALVCAGYSLVSLDRSDIRKVQFVFKHGYGIDGVIASYWNNRLNVKAREYFDAIKMLKNRLYSDQ